MSEHVPVLQVALPLIAAPLCLFIRRARLVRWFAVVVSLACLGMSLHTLSAVLEHGILSYWVGGWAPPLGIELRIDSANGYILLIVAMISAVVMPFGPGYAVVDLPEERHHLYYAAFLLCMCGLFGIASTGDAFNVFVFVEVTSLSSYSLIALGRGRRAPLAAFSYLIMGTIGGTFILIGIGLLYAITGTLNMADLARLLPAVLDSRTAVVAFAFLCVGSSIKLAVFPLHQWLPNAYTYAPAVVSAFLSATATKVSYYVFARVVFTIFGAAFVFGELRLHHLLLPLSLCAMFIGSLAAVYQTDLKRLLAYSSIAQIGYMTLGLSFHNELGLTGGFVHLFNHALMKGGLFLVVGCVIYRLGSSSVADLRGLGKQMPITMGAFAVGGLALIGVPGTVGFVSKWFFVLAALERGWGLVAWMILLSSLLAVLYVWRVVEIVFLAEPPEGREVKEAPLSMLGPTWLLIGASVYFGIHTELTVGVATEAARTLLNGGAW